MKGMSMKEKKGFHISQNSLNVPLHRNPRKPVDSNTHFTELIECATA